MPSATETFAAHLAERLPEATVTHVDASTHTAAQAAAVLGCELDQIVKSLLFIADYEPVMVLVGGAHRVDPDALIKALDVEPPATRADADTVRRLTGYAIGGVPPFGHELELQVVMDKGLLQHEQVWSAAGSPLAVFAAAPARLAEASRALIAPVSVT